MSGDLTVGIDYGAYKVSAAALLRKEDGWSLHATLDVKAKEPTNLGDVGHLSHWISSFIGDLTDGSGYKPRIALERPLVGASGNNLTAIKMAMMAGSIITRLSDLELIPFLVAPASWKKVVIGAGTASKAEVKAWADLFAKLSSKEPPPTQDIADAMAMAVYMTKMEESSDD